MPGKAKHRPNAARRQLFQRIGNARPSKRKRMHGKPLTCYRLTDAQGRGAIRPEHAIIYWWNEFKQESKETGTARHQTGRSYIQVCRVDLMMQEICMSSAVRVVSTPQGRARKNGTHTCTPST